MNFTTVELEEYVITIAICYHGNHHHHYPIIIIIITKADVKVTNLPLLNTGNTKGLFTPLLEKKSSVRYFRKQLNSLYFIARFQTYLSDSTILKSSNSSSSKGKKCEYYFILL